MTGSRIDCPIKDDLIVRASERASWAGRALRYAADDLFEAGSGDGALQGLAERVADNAALISRMAEDIDSRKRTATVDARAAR